MNFTVVWNSTDQDGSEDGVLGQRFDFSAAPAITVVSPNTNFKWRIGSLERIRWTHNLGAKGTLRIELDRDDDGNYEELIADDVSVENPARGQFAWTATGPVHPPLACAGRGPTTCRSRTPATSRSRSGPQADRARSITDPVDAG